jgi:hypothetical protein
MALNMSTDEIQSKLSSIRNTNYLVIIAAIFLTLIFATYLIFSCCNVVRRLQVFLVDRNITFTPFQVNKMKQNQKKEQESAKADDNETYKSQDKDEYGDSEHAAYSKKIAEIKSQYKGYNDKLRELSREKDKEPADVIDERIFTKDFDNY